MRIVASWQQRQIAGCLAFVLAAPFAQAATAASHPAPSGQQTQSSPATPAQRPDDAVGTSTTGASQPEAATGSSTSASPDAVDSSSAALPPAPQQQQNSNSNPVGTAAAAYEKATGIAASRPAGAVVAPAKQKRSRSLLIRVGLIVGACVAVGTVVALSAGSPSRP